MTPPELNALSPHKRLEIRVERIELPEIRVGRILPNITYRATLVGAHESYQWGAGPTPERAIGDLIRTFADDCGITLKESLDPLTPLDGLGAEKPSEPAEQETI